TVASIFKDLGAKIIDADKLGHSVILPNKPAWKKIVKIFGKDILQNDLTINREKLGKIVFANQTLLKKLNEITHPEITKMIKKEIDLAELIHSPSSELPLSPFQYIFLPLDI
ncbi:unnamed protein product, partial [marine sediment metagenome]